MIRDKIYSLDFSQRHKVKQSDFTRERVFTFARLMIFQINISTKSLSVELTRFFQRINYNIEEKSFTKQSYSEARMKMKHEAYIELNEDLVKQYYSSDDYKKYKGYRLIAIDGSRIGLPNKKEIINEFGLAENKTKTIPMATNSTAYDVLNNIVINTYFEKYAASELDLAEKQLEKIKQMGNVPTRDIILLDRGYRSLYLIVKMLISGYNFVLRGTSSGFISEINKVSQSSKSDNVIEIDLTRRSNERISELANENSLKSIKLRVVSVELKDGDKEYLITSLLDKDFSVEELKQLYHLRWNEEVYFHFQKNILEIENFSGRTPEVIKQDYFAKVLSINLSTLIIEDAQEQLDNENLAKENLKYEKYKINKSVALGILKDSVIEMIFSPKEIWDKQYEMLVKAVKKFKIPVIPDRSYQRKNKVRNEFFLKKRKII